jgi:hypothetical protein
VLDDERKARKRYVTYLANVRNGSKADISRSVVTGGKADALLALGPTLLSANAVAFPPKRAVSLVDGTQQTRETWRGIDWPSKIEGRAKGAQILLRKKADCDNAFISH